MKYLCALSAVFLTSIIHGAVIKKDFEYDVSKRAITVKEEPMCVNMLGADYPYMCTSANMCLYCPNKEVGNGVCQVCNGANECPGGEDEEGCTVRTKSYLNQLCTQYNLEYPYSCATIGRSGITNCLSEDQLCDGLWHCSDSSDESECDYSQDYGTANGLCPTPSQNKISGNGAANFDEQILQAHNYFRCLHGAPPMTLSSELKIKATTAAQNSAATGGITHTYIGENLAVIPLPIADATGFGVTKQWYKEVKYYNYADFTKSTDTVGHFTQVVWEDSVNLGCANVVDIDGHTQIACEYDPPGNVNTVQQHVDNVKPPI